MISAPLVRLDLASHRKLTSHVHFDLASHIKLTSHFHFDLASHKKLTSLVHLDVASHVHLYLASLIKLDYLADFDLVSHRMVFLGHLDFDFYDCSVFDLVFWPVESQIFVDRPPVCLALDVAGSNPRNSFLDLNLGIGVQP